MLLIELVLLINAAAACWDFSDSYAWTYRNSHLENEINIYTQKKICVRV